MSPSDITKGELEKEEFGGDGIFTQIQNTLPPSNAY